MPGAANSGSVNTSPNSRESVHVEVTADEVNVVSHHVSMEAVQKGCSCITFLGDTAVDVNRATRDCVGCPQQTDGAACHAQQELQATVCLCSWKAQ